jgi:hypothetical protein
MLISQIIQDELFIKYDEPKLIYDDIRVIGYFPYETKRVKNNSPKFSSSIINGKLAFPDNKIVLICEDIKRFNTQNFALFYHDGGIKIGTLEEITDY